MKIIDTLLYSVIPSLTNLLSFRFVLNTNNFKEFLIKSFLYFSLQRETFSLCHSFPTSRKMEKPSSNGIRSWIAITCHTTAISQQTVSIHQEYLIKIQFPWIHWRSSLHLFCINISWYFSSHDSGEKILFYSPRHSVTPWRFSALVNSRTYYREVLHIMYFALQLL